MKKFSCAAFVALPILVAEYNSKTNCSVYTQRYSIIILKSLSKRKNNLYTTQKYFSFKILFNPLSPIFDPNLHTKNLKKTKHNFIAKLALIKPQI